MRRKLQGLVLTVAVALAISSCGSDGARDAPGDQGGQAVKTVSHFYGETEVPTDPQRVVVLDNGVILGTALILDVPIVGFTAQPSTQKALPFFDDEALAGAENVGFNPPGIERIAALKPDLIIGGTGSITEESGLYPKLEQLAPTVAFDFTNRTPWKETVRRTAAAFGETAAIEERISRYEGRVEQLRTTLGEQSESRVVTLANFRALDDIRIYTSAWCSGSALEEVGLTRPPTQQGTKTIELSIERLGELDADALLYFVGSTGTDPDEAAQAEKVITSHPLWNTLDAVQRGQAFRVDTEHWFTCGTLQAQNLVLDDIERILLGNPR